MGTPVVSQPGIGESRQVSERAFRQQVIDLCHYTGWRYYFTWTSMHSPAGFPDLILVRGVELIAAELKSERGRLSPA